MEFFLKPNYNSTQPKASTDEVRHSSHLEPTHIPQNLKPILDQGEIWHKHLLDELD